MILAFRMGPAASGRGLSDIDSTTKRDDYLGLSI